MGRRPEAHTQAAGVEYAAEVYTGADPIGYVAGLNLKRRRLNESQRGMVAAKIAKLQRGANQHTELLQRGISLY